MRNTRLVLSVMSLFITSAAMAAGFDGKVEWARRVAVSVPVSGIVESIAVDTGQPIKKGQLLLQLEQTPFVAELEEAKAARNQAAGDRREAERDYKQTKELYDRGLISNVELENAELKAKRASAAWNAAGARLKRAEYDLGHSRLVAPFNGWLLGRNAQVGQTIISTQQAQTLLVIAAANEYLARAEVPGKKLRDLKMGDRAVVEVADKKFNGVITVLGLEPVAGRKKDDTYYEVAISFNSGGALLRAGQQAEVSF
ncbi:MAG: efflux RND transporter periplasmic adaptor subunit [Acidiferrobacterales bacterium]|jgi:RND family efflux transporter MFP subunit|nr:efflux RND transporter periplasmic adaptor subunit [Acidiferrobacterales bacterium]